jgi:hypothetical protein
MKGRETVLMHFSTLPYFSRHKVFIHCGGYDYPMKKMKRSAHVFVISTTFTIKINN